MHKTVATFVLGFASCGLVIAALGAAAFPTGQTPGVVNPADPIMHLDSEAPAATTGAATTWQFVGVTEATFDGSGNGGGFIAMTRACASEFPGGRILGVHELMETANPPTVLERAWVQPTRIANFGTGSVWWDDYGNNLQVYSTSASCSNWRVASSPHTGATLDPNGSISWDSCNEVNRVACSAPR